MVFQLFMLMYFSEKQILYSQNKTFSIIVLLRLDFFSLIHFYITHKPILGKRNFEIEKLTFWFYKLAKTLCLRLDLYSIFKTQSGGYYVNYKFVSQLNVWYNYRNINKFILVLMV